MLWSGLYCYTVKCSEILAHIKLLYNPRVNKVFTSHSNCSLYFYAIFCSDKRFDFHSTFETQEISKETASTG